MSNNTVVSAHETHRKLNMQDSASLVITLVFMSGTYVVIRLEHNALKIPLVITLKPLAIMLRFNHKQ